MGGQGSKRNVISGPMGKRTGRAPANELGQGAGPVDRQGCGSGAGGLKVVVKVPWCQVSVPARGFLFCSFCLFVCLFLLFPQAVSFILCCLLLRFSPLGTTPREEARV